jgi:hypothetical protein
LEKRRLFRYHPVLGLQGEVVIVLFFLVPVIVTLMTAERFRRMPFIRSQNTALEQRTADVYQ